jgi:hypothetical protein
MFEAARRRVTQTNHMRRAASREGVAMTDTDEPGPGIEDEGEDKLLDDLDPDDAEAAGITGGGNYDYGDGPVTRK